MLNLSSLGFVGKNVPLCVAGPCSAESAEQMLSTARALKDIGIGVFRAGVWKPRTDPNSFQGVGEGALEWLGAVKRETGLLTATEVATPRHVELVMEHGVDILWIGSRTTTNPFAMQELAESLRGVDIPILVKNPINADIDLWIGAMQRLNMVGISRLGAIHRGFSMYNKSYYRNDPQWHIPIELRRRIPQLPILCDPSHIAGRSDLIFSLSQQALDLQFDGLFIESHIDPSVALSDAKQQVTPLELEGILSKLVMNDVSGNDDYINNMRLEIDFMDNSILEILKNRMDVVRCIGEYKIKNNIALLQSDRYNDMLEKYINTAEGMGISPEFVKHLFEMIHEESLREQLGIRRD